MAKPPQSNGGSHTRRSHIAIVNGKPVKKQESIPIANKGRKAAEVSGANDRSRLAAAADAIGGGRSGSHPVVAEAIARTTMGGTAHLAKPIQEGGEWDKRDNNGRGGTARDDWEEHRLPVINESVEAIRDEFDWQDYDSFREWRETQNAALAEYFEEAVSDDECFAWMKHRADKVASDSYFDEQAAAEFISTGNTPEYVYWDEEANDGEGGEYSYAEQLENALSNCGEDVEFNAEWDRHHAAIWRPTCEGEGFMRPSTEHHFEEGYARLPYKHPGLTSDDYKESRGSYGDYETLSEHTPQWWKRDRQHYKDENPAEYEQFE